MPLSDIIFPFLLIYIYAYQNFEEILKIEFEKLNSVTKYYQMNITNLLT